MKNKKVISLMILIISLIVIYFGIYFYQNYSLKSSFSKETNTLFNSESKMIRCNLNIFEPEFAYVFGTDNDGHIAFNKTKKIFSQNYEQWQNSYIGGTTVKNTTFNNLLKMVKKDCSQFQKDKKEEEITWGYREYDRKAEEQKERQKQLEREMLKKQGKKFIEIDSNRSLVEQLMENGMTIEKIIEAINTEGETDEATKQQLLSDPIIINYLKEKTE